MDCPGFFLDWRGPGSALKVQPGLAGAGCAGAAHNGEGAAPLLGRAGGRGAMAVPEEAEAPAAGAAPGEAEGGPGAGAGGAGVAFLDDEEDDDFEYEEVEIGCVPPRGARARACRVLPPSPAPSPSHYVDACAKAPRLSVPLLALHARASHRAPGNRGPPPPPPPGVSIRRPGGSRA